MSSEKELELFRKNIQYLRKKYGYSQKKMAEILQISASSLYRLEKGIIPRCLTAKTLFLICQHFQISADCILNEEITE